MFTRLVEVLIAVNAVAGVLAFLGVRAVIRKITRGVWRKPPPALPPTTEGEVDGKHRTSG